MSNSPAQLIEVYARAKSDLDYQLAEGWGEKVKYAKQHYKKALKNLNNWLRAAGFEEVSNG